MVYLVLASNLLLANGWSDWKPATCLPDDCFCESLHDGLIRQPANTWSSLAFVVVAFWIYFRRKRAASQNVLVMPTTDLILLVGSLIATGLGSAFYHASLTFFGQVLDVSGMYFIATFILFHRLGPRFKIPALWSVLAFVGLNGFLMVGQVTTPSMRRVAFGLLLTTAIVVEWRAIPSGRAWLALGAGLMVVAFAIWALDRWRLVCEPDGLLQGHALWHVLGALAAACLYLRYEKP